MAAKGRGTPNIWGGENYRDENGKKAGYSMKNGWGGYNYYDKDGKKIGYSIVICDAEVDCRDNWGGLGLLLYLLRLVHVQPLHDNIVGETVFFTGIDRNRPGGKIGI